MKKIIKTSSGTLYIDRVEYNQYPPPKRLFKVMKRCWAEELLDNGTIRFGNLETYRSWENEILGDKYDGKGMYEMQGHCYDTGSINPVFAWCSSNPDILEQRITEIAESNGYDCCIEIHSPQTFINRTSATLLSEYQGDLHLHCGQVLYDRGDDVDKERLNSQKFHFNVFQKSTEFCDDKEYRLSITDCSQKMLYRDAEHITINVGDCSDIISIKNL